MNYCDSPIKEYTITMNNGDVIIKKDWNNLTVKNFIESINIDSNNVHTVKLTNMI